MLFASEDFNLGALRLHLGDRTGNGSGGPEIRVYGPTTSGHSSRQLLRFDCFRDEPHYHYDPDGHDDKIDLLGADADDSIGWSLLQLRQNLPEMIRRAGGTEEAVTTAASIEIKTAIDKIAHALGRKKG